MFQHLKVRNTFADPFDFQRMRSFSRLLPLLFSVLFFALSVRGQQAGDGLLTNATLENVVQYALKHYPLLQQSLLDEKIATVNAKARLADWAPQVTLNVTPQHYFERPTAVFNGNVIQQGAINSSPVQLLATQQLINRDLLLATSTKGEQQEQSQRNTENIKINVVVSVSKAFYATLATMQQIEVSKEEIIRLERSLKDAQSRYNAGIADKTDHKRATIALNNSRATLAANQELLKANVEYLKALMGYPAEGDLQVVYDQNEMELQIAVDTISPTDYKTRIEYRQMLLTQKLQKAGLNYNYMAFMPNVSLNAAYAYNFFSNSFSELYAAPLPYSYVNLAFSFPILQGGKRAFNVRQQKLQLGRIDYGLENLQNTVNAEHAQAVANYKSHLAKYEALRENMALAQEVYDVISLQYQQGVTTYLEVVTAETDLRNAKINYYNGLYQLLSAKVDLQKALGQIKF